MQGAWAILLSYYSGEPDVLFGVTVAGRPPDLRGVESVLGLFINTLPLRLTVSPECQVLPWLKEVLAENVRLRQFEYTPLVQIQRCSEVPRGERCFTACSSSKMRRLIRPSAKAGSCSAPKRNSIGSIPTIP